MSKKIHVEIRNGFTDLAPDNKSYCGISKVKFENCEYNMNEVGIAITENETKVSTFIPWISVVLVIDYTDKK